MTQTDFHSHGNQFSTEFKINITKSKREISHTLDRLHVTASKRGRNKRLVYTDSRYIFTCINRA